MRFVEKGDCPEVLANDSKSRIDELENAGKHRADKKKKGSFEYTLYKHPDVKAALEEAFYRKCAYCESYYAATQPIDVEHWKPKSIYPELALDWDNLLPSCIDCNRFRYHTDPRTGDEMGAGKGDKFPLGKPDAKGEERPLLIHPCKDRPSDHLAWHGRDASVLDARDGSEKGRESIQVYGLNRYALVAGRRDVLFKVRLHLSQLTTLCRLKSKTTEAEDEGRRVWLLDQFIEQELLALKAFTAEDAPYSEMCKEEVRRTLPSRFGP